MKLYIELALLAETVKNDPEPDVAQAQIWILVQELRHWDICREKGVSREQREQREQRESACRVAQPRKAALSTF